MIMNPAIPQSALGREVPGLPERMQMHPLWQSGDGGGGAAEGPQQAVGKEEVAKQRRDEEILPTRSEKKVKS